VEVYPEQTDRTWEKGGKRREAFEEPTERLVFIQPVPSPTALEGRYTHKIERQFSQALRRYAYSSALNITNK